MPTENVKTLYAAVVGCSSGDSYASARTVKGFITIELGSGSHGVGGLSLYKMSNFDI